MTHSGLISRAMARDRPGPLQRLGQAAGRQGGAGHVDERPGGGDADTGAGHHGVGPQGGAPDVGVAVGGVGGGLAVIDDGHQVLQHRGDLGGHADLAPPGADIDPPVGVDDHRRRPGLEGHGLAAVEVEAAVGVLDPEPAVEGGHRGWPVLAR